MTRSALCFGALAAVASGGAISACRAHDELTPAIAVQPGAAARAVALLGHGGPNDPTLRSAAIGDAGAPGSNDGGGDALGSIAFACLEARGAIRALARVPCTVTIAATAPQAPESAFISENGGVNVPLSAGSYHVTVGRGPEYARVTWDAEVHAGKKTWGPKEGAVVLHRVLDTRGYLAVDLRPLAVGATPVPSVDDVRDAVFDDVAEGVEIIAGDAPFLARAVPIVQAAKMDDLLAALAPYDAPGLEVFDAWADRDAFLTRLLTHHPATAIAPPPMRVYVRVDDDGSLATWSPAREADLLRGLRDRRDVVLTTGPFVRVTANGSPVGGVARVTPNGDVEVRVHVECAAWTSVDRVSVERASGARVVQPIALRPTAPAARSAETAARSADVTLHLHATADDAFVVIVDSSTASANAPADAVDPAGESRAMTGALWIDADGDGESLGRRVP
jgi:hypothetical protein